MIEKEYYKLSITVYSYKDVVDRFMEENNVTREEVVERLARNLQVSAWADAYKEMQNYLDWENSKKGKKFIAEQEAKEAEG